MEVLPRNEIVCGNAAEVMAGWPDECIDLTVTSPPYDPVDFDEAGNLITYPRQGLRDYEGYTWEFVSIARQLWRVTKRGGVVVWVVGDQTVNGSETGTSFRQALYFRELGFNVETMIYDRNKTATHDPRNKRYKQQFEYMFVFSKGSPKTYNEIKDKPVKHKVATSVTSRNPNGTMRQQGKVKLLEYQARSNIWNIPNGYMKSTSDKEAFKVPAIFPEALAADHIRSWSNPGDLVLDCFNGSGTTTKKAYQLEREFVGIDISANYCDIARRRVAAATMPIMEAIKKPEQLLLGIDNV